MPSSEQFAGVRHENLQRVDEVGQKWLIGEVPQSMPEGGAQQLERADSIPPFFDII
jgi:hypothetical protein